MSEMLKEHVFISYVHEDKREVARLVRDLQARGERVWWDEDLLPGQALDPHIEIAIRRSFAAIICISSASAAQVRSGQFRELAIFQELVSSYSQLATFLVPVRLDDCEVPYYRFNAQLLLSQILTIDLFPEDRRSANLERLVAGLASAPERPIAARRQ
jgi:hypothetical protein